MTIVTEEVWHAPKSKRKRLGGHQSCWGWGQVGAEGKQKGEKGRGREFGFGEQDGRIEVAFDGLRIRVCETLRWVMSDEWWVSILLLVLGGAYDLFGINMYVEMKSPQIKFKVVVCYVYVSCYFSFVDIISLILGRAGWFYASWDNLLS
jgi:hypothetical protein